MFVIYILNNMMKKLLKSFLFIAFSGLVLISCNEQKNEKEVAANIKKIAVNIEGMTCEIGCAKTIESKLSKTEGISVVSVSFDDKKGIVEYDANKTDVNAIAAVVQEIAGGDLYKVTGTELIKGAD